MNVKEARILRKNQGVSTDYIKKTHTHFNIETTVPGLSICL